MQSQVPETANPERINLLENIHKLESNEPTDPNTFKALRDLKSRYNELIEAHIQSIRYPNYLEYFPTEIWVQVFLRIVDDNWMDILAPMQVCQRWTSIIISEPRLWTSIYIQSNVESFELAYSALSLSKDFPLGVTIEVPIDPNVHKTILQRGTSRIQYLRFKPLSGYFSDWRYEADVQLIKVSANVLKDMGPLPSLYSLTVDTYFPGTEHDWSPVLVNLDAPQIRYVESAVFPQDVLATSRYTRLQDLGTSSSLETALPDLVKFTDLRRLSLLAQPKLDELTSSSELPAAPCKDIALLKSLEYLQEYSEFIWPLLKHVNSSLRVLELEITWKQLLKLFTAIQDVHSLHDLSLYIPLQSIKGESEANRWRVPALPQVQRFVLEITEQVVGPQTLESSDFAEAAHFVWEALDNSLPRIRTLHLKSDIYTNDLVRIMQTVENLTSLDLTTVVWSDRAEKTTCSTLKTLKTEDQEVLRYLSMPNLTSIRLLRRNLVDEGESEPFDCSFASTVQWIAMPSEDASTILDNGGEFTQINTIEWYSCRHGYHYQDASFPSLTKIIFGEGYAHQGPNAFCELLLRYPSTCPHLDTICFRVYPEWDMLLYMLLRRNSRHSQDNISRITRIEIPGFPAPCVLIPLRDLLIAKIPLDMPSPHELSFMEVQSILFDPNMYVNFIFTDTAKILTEYS
jgi:hypothetical protein